LYCSVCGTAYAKPAGTGATTLKPPPAARPATIDLRTPVPGAKTPAPKPAPQPAANVERRHIAQFTDRFERARKYSRSAQISRFGTDRMGNIQDPHQMYDKLGKPTLQTLKGQSSALAGHAATEAARPASHSNLSPHNPVTSRHLPNISTTQHQAMAALPRHAPPATPTPRLAAAGIARPRLTRATSRALTIGAAVAVMGIYVWSQNYPKLAIQNAGDKAGLSASLPSYLPSSYSLADTSTGPGLVTLKFTSPSAAEALQISQHRTTWDSSSLVDNYIAKSADDYATVQGQGLTIYVWGQNQAAWVNHGVWYTIAGASRLSREQVLKIAYSL
jgi:hypothetical protein